MDPNYGQTQISLSQKNIYKISYESIRLMKFLCQKNYTANINYHDFMASILDALLNISINQYYINIRNMNAKMKYKDIPANIKHMIRKNKKLNKKIDLESRRQKILNKKFMN